MTAAIIGSVIGAGLVALGILIGNAIFTGGDA